MKSTMNLEEHNEIRENKEKKIKVRIVDENLMKNRKSKKSLARSSNNGAFRNNHKNYQYDYEEDYYEPY